MIMNMQKLCVKLPKIINILRLFVYLLIFIYTH